MIAIRILRIVLIAAGLVALLVSGLLSLDSGRPADAGLVLELEYLRPMVFGIGLLIAAVTLTPYTHPARGQNRAGSE